MPRFSVKMKVSEKPDTEPYTLYYPHSVPVSSRNWTQDYYQLVSIDPATKNFAFRIERRYHNGRIITLAFDKVSIENKNPEFCETYENLTKFLDQFREHYPLCHFIVLERQMADNYKTTRIAQHTISYFSFLLRNMPLLPAVVEVDPKLKGKILRAPRGITQTQLKAWAIEKAIELINKRKDGEAFSVLKKYSRKMDDLADTICQVEALFIIWGLGETIEWNQEEEREKEEERKEEGKKFKINLSRGKEETKVAKKEEEDKPRFKINLRLK